MIGWTPSGVRVVFTSLCITFVYHRRRHHHPSNTLLFSVPFADSAVTWSLFIGRLFLFSLSLCRLSSKTFSSVTVCLFLPSSFVQTWRTLEITFLTVYNLFGSFFCGLFYCTNTLSEAVTPFWMCFSMDLFLKSSSGMSLQSHLSPLSFRPPPFLLLEVYMKYFP